ncbi:MAG: response regulator [Rhodospirillales bacterium]|nr:response regulator [Alphaproteobacteria bacterium]MCB9981930.1 response regulator [Rhodospirillales bacterium]
MELIRGSTEHYFMKALDDLKGQPTHWYGLHFCLSKILDHADLVSNVSEMAQKIDAARARSDVFADELYGVLKDCFKGSLCVFEDLDVFALVQVCNKMDIKHLDEAFNKMKAKLPKGYAGMDGLASQLRNYQKLADEKVLSARKFEAYRAMADKRKVSSIQVRRKRRESPLVMVVEDDRFTAHYASMILSTDFDLVVCKDGEEAVQAYIEHAPDIVFLDIHLPGMSGHDVLQSIHAIDPQGFVVMLSVDTVRDNIVRASQMGARNFIKKPFTKERLIEIVKNSPYVRELTRSDRAGSETMFH